MMNVDTDNKKAQLVEQRKEQILSAAKHVFAQNGYRCTKIDQIADELQVGKGTLYRYFKDKKSLFIAVFEQGVGTLLKTIKAKALPIADPKYRLETAIKTYFEFFENDRELIEIIMQVRSEFKDDYRRVFLASYSDYIERIQDNLRIGIKSGVFRNLDVEKTAEAISGTLQGVLQSLYIREFGRKNLTAEKEKILSSSYNTTDINNTVSSQKLKRELLTDRIEAVTALLLQGLLKRDN